MFIIMIKKYLYVVVNIIVIAVMVIGYAPVVFATSDISISPDQLAHVVPDQVIVKYKKNHINLETVGGRNSAVAHARGKSLELKDHFDHENISLLQTANHVPVATLIQDLKNDPDIEYVEPNYTREVSTIIANDTHKDLLWGLDNTGQTIDGDFGLITGTADSDIDAPEAWAINEGTNADAIVAVIDIGVDYNHPDLAANMWDGTNCKDENGNVLGGCNHGYDYQSNDKSPMPANSSAVHGTHVAGIIAAVKNNTIGVIGIAPHAKIMALKFGLNVSSEVKAIDFAIQNGAKIINASYGGAGFSQAEYDAISRFRDAGGIFMAAAGNDGTSNDTSHFYPSDYDLSNIVSVAATDQNDALASFSNYGVTSVDVGAPGVNIASTMPSNTYGYLSGTSMATPYTAGLAALIWGYQNQLSSTQIKNIILNDGDTLTGLTGITTSGKRINADRSLFDADIINAQSIHDTAVEGTISGQYTAESRTTYQAAIDAASVVKNNAAAGSSDIATAVATLDAATATFLASVIPADFTVLNAQIAAAQLLHDTAVEGTNPGDYIVGSRAILQTAIDTASALSVTAPQSQVDAMLATLTTAITTFNASIVPARDTVAPVITLVGNAAVTINFGETYHDAGATALDNKDGDLTSHIVVVNNVNTREAGTYIITYNVTDLDGNPADQVTRTVTVNHASSGGEIGRAHV